MIELASDARKNASCRVIKHKMDKIAVVLIFL